MHTQSLYGAGSTNLGNESATQRWDEQLLAFQQSMSSLQNYDAINAPATVCVSPPGHCNAIPTL